MGPFNPQIFPEVHVSRFGVIPKADPGSRRLILDLLSPEGASVNDGIDPNVCLLSYMTVDNAARAIGILKVLTTQSQSTQRTGLSWA